MKAQKKLLAAATTAILFVLPVDSTARCAPHTEVRSNVVLRENLEDLQRRVNDGDNPWRVEARAVALDELLRYVPALHWVDASAISLKVESRTPRRVVFIWTRGDGRATYRMTLLRHSYLLPLAGDLEGIVWVAERTEITTLA
jgi:hypothetical protein